MSTNTNEFSFILKPTQHGVGVFAAHAIAKGAALRLFGDEESLAERSRMLSQAEVPEAFQDYCMHRAGGQLVCPKDFGSMPIGWYLNHSQEPNAIHRDFRWYAARDIAAGEEILIDYSSLEEPEEAREEYYKG